MPDSYRLNIEQLYSFAYLCNFICLFSPTLDMNDMLQSEQKVKGLSSVSSHTLCQVVCMFERLKTYRYWTLYRLSPVWAALCNPRRSALLKDLKHCGQLKGFSPVWIFICNLRWSALLKGFKHCGQLKGFSPVWILICRFRCSLLLKFFEQAVQEKLWLSPVRDFIWALRFCTLLKVFVHFGQL